MIDFTDFADTNATIDTTKGVRQLSDHINKIDSDAIKKFEEDLKTFSYKKEKK